jgi:glucose/arabinose dehydrogenase
LILQVHDELILEVPDATIDPRFADNHTIYWTYAEPREGGTGTALAKGVLIEDDGAPRVEDVTVLFRQQPTFPSDGHYGSRIVFAPDGTLFVTLGASDGDVASARTVIDGFWLGLAKRSIQVN